MIIEELIVKNWRGFRKEHTFRFDERINLLVGDNEAGKSTIFEALQRVLFDRHTGGAQEIKAIRPLDSSLAPEGCVILRDGSRRYKVVKRFLSNKTSELYSEHGGSWRLDHDGDVADREIRALFDGDVPGRGVTAEEHRGIAQALWYLQTDGSLPTWNDAIQEGLAGADGALEILGSSPEETALFQGIEDEYRSHWTPTGQVRKHSDLYDLEEEIPEIEARIAALKQELRQASKYRTDLESFETQRFQKRSVLKTKEEELARLDKQLQEVDELRAHRKILDEEYEKARNKRDGFIKDLQRIEQLGLEISGLEKDVEGAHREKSRVDAEAKEARHREQKLGKVLQGELKPRRREAQKRLEGLKALQQMRDLQERLGGLERKIAQIDEISDAIDAGEKELARLLAPTEDVVDEFQRRRQRLEVLRATAMASAVRVRFELDDDLDVRAEPETKTEDDEFLVTRPTEFHLPGVGRIAVQGGGAALEDTRHEIEKLEAENERVLKTYEVQDGEELTELSRSRRELEQRVREDQQQLKLLTDGASDPRRELKRIEDRIRTQTIRVDELDGTDAELSEERLAREIAKSERKYGDSGEEIEDVERRKREAGDAVAKYLEEGAQISQKVGKLDEALGGRRRVKAETLGPYGTVQQLESLSDDAVKVVEKKKRELDELLADFERRVKKPEETYNQVKRTVASLRSGLGELETKISDRQGRLNHMAGDDLYEQIGDLEGRIEEKRRRLAVVRERADGAKLLYEMVRDFRDERAAALSGPVTRRTNQWLKLLTDSDYQGIDLARGITPEAVEAALFEERLPFEELSHGTREQVVVLLRLAIAQLLSDEERQVVILDDRLVNADPVRMNRLCRVLEEAAQDCQILLATCNGLPYEGLDANVIRVPEDGRTDVESEKAYDRDIELV